MKKALLSLFILSLFWCSAQDYKEMIEVGTYSVLDIQKVANKHFEKVGNGKGSGHKQFKRWEYNALREVDKNGFLPSSKEQLTAFQKFKKKQPKNKTTAEAANWKEIGPTYWNRTSGWNPGVGRITSIAVDPNNYNHIIIGGNTGGVWRTTDKGKNWTPLSDYLTNLDVYSVAIDPNDSKTYYWGSKWGIIYKSTNSGQSWTEIGSAGNFDINKILIHPTNSDILFATGTYSGIYKSTNGGGSWSKVTNSTRGYDIEFKPGDPNTVYASGTSFYKSTDGGNVFSEVTGVGPGVKLIGVSADKPTRVYIVEASGSKFGGFYKSTNAGNSFTKLDHGTKNYFGYSSTGDDNSGQAPRDMAIAVNPSNANEVHIAGILTWRSNNGGTTFDLTSQWTHTNANNANVGYCHADVDIMQYHGNTLYVGTDGGIFISENASKTISTNYYTDLSTGLGIRQFYKIGVSQSDPVVISGGSQDNGTSVWYSEQNAWYDWLGADGMESFVDHSDPYHLYGTSQNGSLYESYNGGNSYNGLPQPDGKSGNWVTPFEQDPTNATTIYVGVDQVYKKVGSNNWTAISQNFGGNLNQLKIAPSNNNIMFAAKWDELYKTSTGSGTWTTISGVSGNINAIAIHPTNSNKIAVATSGFDHVYVSNDGGTSWSSFKKNLPNITAYSLAWDKESNNGLYLGMSYGIYYINDNKTDWTLYAENLPNSKVNEIEINYPTNKLYAATYGRGMWEASLYGQAVSLATDVKVNNISGVTVNGCGTTISPIVSIKNNGTDVISNFVAELYINDVLKTTLKKDNLSLTSNSTIDVEFGSLTSPSGDITVKVLISKPNGVTDQNTDNNSITQTTTLHGGNLHTFYIDNFSKSENLDWEIKNLNNKSITKIGDASESTTTTQTEYNFCLEEGCFNIKISNAFKSGSCDATDWDANIVYYGDAGSGGEGTGETVAYNGKKYRAKYWAKGTTYTPGSHDVWLEIGDCISSNNDDKLGLKDANGKSYFETKVSDFTSPLTKNFCNGNALTVDFYSNKTNALNCETITFTANVAGNATDYSWNFGSNATPATATGSGPHQVSYLTVGSKTVTLDVDGTPETKTEYITINQDQSLVSTVEIQITDGKNPSCGEDLIEFTATTTNGGTAPTYKWTLNNITQPEKGNTFSVNGYKHNDEVKCTTTSNKACVVNATTSSNTITLIKETCTGTQKWLEEIASIYPNPTTNQLNIKSKNNTSFSWKIYDSHGRVLNIGNIKDETKSLDLSSYASGVYYLQVITNNKSSITEIIKK